MKANIKHNKINKNATYFVVCGWMHNNRYMEARRNNMPVHELPRRVWGALSAGHDVTTFIDPKHEISVFFKSKDVMEQYLTEMNSGPEYFKGLFDALSKYDNPPVVGTYDLGDIYRCMVEEQEQ